MAKLFRIFFICTLLFPLCEQSFAQKSEKFTLKCVVIDPGHGGRDAGACYGKLYEKNVVLNMALALGNKIKKAFPDIKVVYTRDIDIEVPLKKRGEIANKAKGDLFISIHVNSTDDKNTNATGTETFTLGLHKSAANLATAQKENSVIILEEDYQKKYEGFDPNNAESYIMFGLGQYSFNVSSISFAGLIEDTYKSKSEFKSRGIKQSGFLVLWGVAMPSILTEIGFINNANDRKILSSTAGQEKMAELLFVAFKKYKNQVELESRYASNGNRESNAASTNEKMSKFSDKSSGYAVQILVADRKKEVNKANFGRFSADVFFIKEKNKYKYFVGVMDSYDDVLSLRSTLRKDKYKDCFVVGVKRGKIVPYNEVKNK